MSLSVCSIHVMILYIKHIDIEGPETIGLFFEKKGFVSKTVDLSRGEELPVSLQGIEAVVVLGGPMNVDEEDKYPFLKGEDLLIRKVLKEKVPYLGICLGSQLLAKAAGAKVTKSPVEEIGWKPVRLTPEGRKDPLFKDLPQGFTVFQWHGDTFDIPEGGQWLVKGDDCPRQALKVGPCAYGLQFHIEITDKSIRDWSEGYYKNDPQRLKTRQRDMLDGYQKNKSVFEKHAQTVYNNFLKIIQDRRQNLLEN